MDTNRGCFKESINSETMGWPLKKTVIKTDSFKLPLFCNISNHFDIHRHVYTFPLTTHASLKPRVTHIDIRYTWPASDTFTSPFQNKVIWQHVGFPITQQCWAGVIGHFKNETLFLALLSVFPDIWLTKCPSLSFSAKSTNIYFCRIGY